MSDNQITYLHSLSPVKLYRLSWRMWERIGPGGCYGWDRPTLNIVHPHLSAVDMTIRYIGVRFFHD